MRLPTRDRVDPRTSPTVPGRAPAWQRRYRRHRRVLAALLAGVVVWGVLAAVRPAPAATASGVVARHDLVPGSTLTADDLVVEQRPAAALPADAVVDPAALTGRTVAFPVRAGEAVSARHVVAAALLFALGPGLVASPVTLADAASASLVSAGDVVDVLAATTGSTGGAADSSVVASRVRVLVAPSPGSGSGGGGLLSAPAADPRGGSVLVLATTTAQALALARAAVGSRLSLVLHGP
ncbi:MAG: RcpC/CpaB family pilus assembly protein [Candidatus Nanopelagicales bacterium]